MEDNSREVWVFVEQRSGKPAEVSFELLSKGRKLAREIDGSLKALVIGHDIGGVARQTFRYGATEALLIDHEALRDYRTMPYARVVCELVASRKPRIVLFGATTIGRDLAPRVASFTRAGLTADCTDLQISDVKYLRKDYKDLLLQIRPAFGGNVIGTIIAPDVAIQMATVREGVMQMVPVDNPQEGTITEVPYVAEAVDEAIQVIERHHRPSESNLKHAPVVVAGGYGMGSRKSFEMLFELADMVGGEVAATRAAVDAGFASTDRQVGQTGLTVRPKLYIACGISGAVQHVAGMQGANRIIAINTDPEAPILELCHYAIVGDALRTIPLFIETYKETLK